MNSTDLSSENIRMSFGLLKYRSVYSIERPSCPGLNHKREISAHDHRPFNYNDNYSRSSAKYLTAHSVLLPFQTFSSLLFDFFLSAWRMFCPFVWRNLILRHYFKSQEPLLAGSLCPSFPSVQVQGTLLISISRVVEFRSYRLLNTRRMILLKEAWCFHDTRIEIVRFDIH